MYSAHRAGHVQSCQPTPQDVDQRITRDVERLAGDVAELVPSLVKPVLDLAWFSSQLWALTGRRGSAILYLYAALGFGCLRCGIWPAQHSLICPIPMSLSSHLRIFQLQQQPC
jgi:ABC transporter transmembrane region 2